MATLKKKSVKRFSLSLPFLSRKSNANDGNNSVPDGSRRRAQTPPPTATRLSPIPTANHQRAVSAQLQLPTVGGGLRKAASQGALRPAAPAHGTRSRPNSPPMHLEPPPFDGSARMPAAGSPRIVSSPLPGVAGSHGTHLTPPRESAGNSKSKRRSWFGGSGKLTKHREAKAPRAWVAGEGQSKPYDLQLLTTAQTVPELWDENGDALVYLFPRTSHKGPSFRVDSTTFSSSATLTKLAFGNLYSMPAALQTNAAVAQEAHRMVASANGQRTSIATPPLIGSATASFTDGSEDSQDSRGLAEPDPGLVHLYLPLRLSTDGVITATKEEVPQLSDEDIETLIQARNLFAFLLGQSLVATEQRPSFYSIFLGTSEYLERFGFSNLDSSTYGEVAHGSFEAYVEELRLGDVRGSDEKTIDMLVLSERMKSVTLFNEAFVHAVGKWEDIKDNPKLGLVSPVTINRLEKAVLDLNGRKLNVSAKLTEFDFPGLFAGLWISSTVEEAKAVRFSKWKDSYNSTKSWLRGYYKHKYGAWPPKASSKKNDLELGGLLNRLVLKELYRDVSSVYDLLVDRTSLTTRTHDVDLPEHESTDVMVRALRQVLDEYDRSTPPVLPPIPFDTPIKPKLLPESHSTAGSVEKAMARKLKKQELHKVLEACYNKDSAIKTPFMDSYLDYDLKQMEGATIAQMAEIRYGQWVFFYAILQSLPMLVIDAPGIKWTDRVEYFLCIPPRQGVPWAREDPSANRSWYGVAGSDKVVYLPSDLIQYGVEGVFRRSHCWEVAAKWTQHSIVIHAAAEETLEPPLTAPPATTDLLALPSPPSRTSSPPASAPASNRHSMVLLSNLEALPVPSGVAPPGLGNSETRSVASDPAITFDAILGSIGGQGQNNGKKKKNK